VDLLFAKKIEKEKLKPAEENRDERNGLKFKDE